MSNGNDICSGCTQCCKVLAIGDTFRGEPFKKPAGKWCNHCAVGKGCTVYDERPETCQIYECVYLQGVLRGEKMDPALRPDRSGVVLSATTDGHLAAYIDPHKPDAWKRGEVWKLIRGAVRSGLRVTIATATGKTKKVLLWDKRVNKIAINEMEFTDPDQRGMQWSIPGTNKLVGFL